MKKYLLAALCILLHRSAVGQLSGYGSVSYGQSTNPLYNYQHLSDRLVQTYVEINDDRQLASSAFRYQYVGGSMIFNRLSGRNYYEHRIAAGFDTKLFSAASPEQNDDDSSGAGEEQDSTGLFYHTDIQTAARYDKREFREFDNYGFLWNNALRFSVGDESVLRISNKTEYRNYQYLLPFRNISEILTIVLENGTASPLQYGAFLSAGLKYFPTVAYDTTLFEETPSYTVEIGIDSSLVGNGQNQHWVYTPYADSIQSDKTVLARPETKAVYQIAFGGFLQRQWENGSIRAEGVYRVNSRSTLLTLVQNSSTLTLNEDLYNSDFSAHGPELHCIVKYLFPGNVQLLTNIDLEHHTFETPSYDLVTGVILKSNRTDDSFNLEIYLSRYFRLTDQFGFDITAGGNYLRNASDDPYNDYSVQSYNLTVGIGL